MLPCLHIDNDGYPVKSHQNLGNGRKGLKDKALGTGVSSKNAHIKLSHK